VSLEEEWELGTQLEADLAQRLEIVNDATLQNYVNAMGQRMARQTTLGDRPWRFKVVADPEINAFNVPGGLVYVHTGLLAQAATAAEFAGALAHEIGHGVARHGTRRYSQAQDANLLATILLGSNPGAIAQIGAGSRGRLVETVSNADGRTDQPLIADQPLRIGTYELAFHVGAYFADAAVTDPPYLDIVPVRFSIAEPERHYHVPLLVAPWSYTTYRGS
jgi:hydroxyisourate hydrolase